jgi:hypothetical protein
MPFNFPFNSPFDDEFTALPGAGLLTLSTTEGDLAASSADARWTPVHLVFDVPADMNIVIVAKIGDEAVLTLLVFDDNFDGLQPLFTGKSTVTITGTLGTGRNVDISILPNGGWTRSSVYITPYVAFDATLTSNTTEGDLALIPADARWIPVRLIFDVPSDTYVVIVAQIGDDSILTMVVFDDNFDGLQPLFTEKSTIEITGSFGSGRTIDVSILPNGGWIRESVKLIPYVAWEAII